MRLAKRSRFLLPFLLLAIPGRGLTAIVYVNRNATGAVHDGKSWATALTTVQSGIGRTATAGEVWVASGIYTENITLSDGVKVYGGFAGTETQRSQRDWKENATILDGGGAGSVVRTISYNPTTLDGFTIRNGKSTDGAGVLIEGPATLANDTITGNTSTIDGGGIFVLDVATISDCVITNNAAVGTANWPHSSGGGISVQGRATITRCLLSNNYAYYAGGLHGYGQTTITDSIVSHNRAHDSGGIYLGGNSGTIANCTVVANVADVVGGIYFNYYAGITNTVVAYNSSGIRRTSLNFRPFSHNNVFGNGQYNYEVMADPTGTDGNISQDPLFANASGGDYHLPPGSPCVDAGDDSVVTAGDTDLDGHPRIVGGHVDIGAYETPPPGPAVSVSLGRPVTAPPSVLDDVAYAGGTDGKLYAYTASDLKPVPGFPVDIAAAVGTPVSLNSRPAVYYGKTGKAIYLTTSLGHVVKVLPSGQVAWTFRPLNGLAMSTPAVTPDGSVYVDLGLGAASVMNFLFKLDETSGLASYVSPFLGSSPATGLSDRSAALDQRYAYVNASGTSLGSLAILNQDNLTVRASFAPGEDALPPFLSGASTYIATKAGSVFKVNSTTMSQDTTFGSLGQVKLSEPITAGPFLDASGAVYIGTASGKVYSLDGNSGARKLFFDTGKAAAITGLLVLRSGVAVFGTADGTLEQAAIGNPAGAALSGPLAGGPVYDPLQMRLFAVTTSGQLYSIPAL